jgi:hypothetical protein
MAKVSASTKIKDKYDNLFAEVEAVRALKQAPKQ